MKRKIVLLLLILSVLIISFGCTKNLSKEEEYELLASSDVPVNTIKASFSIDTYNLQEVVGNTDYVFVAKVTAYKKTIFDTPSEIPETVYAVQVIENIKGELIVNEEIELIKKGGLDKEYKYKYIFIDDILPQVDNYYIFCTYALKSGEIRASAQNSNLKIENIRNLHEETNYLNILDAYENQNVEYIRERYTSKYDKSNLKND
ncbi:MAG: hypothetical protein WCR54_05730 [Clostridia bacterium]